MSPLAKQIRDALRGPVMAAGQSELARRTGISQSSISQWLSGRRGLPPEQLDALAAACELELVVRARKLKG